MTTLSVETLFGVADGRYFTSRATAEAVAEQLFSKEQLKLPAALRTKTFDKSNAVVTKQVLTVRETGKAQLHFHLSAVLRVDEPTGKTK